MMPLPLLPRALLVSTSLRRTLHKAAVVWKDVLDNPFYDKYRSKLERVQGSIQSNAGCETSKERKHIASPDVLQAPYPGAARPDLNSVMKVDLIHDKTSDEIEKIWVEFHRTKDSVCGIMPSATYLQLHAKAVHCPMFVYPLPCNDGYEMWFAQFSGQRCYFTSLINYQKFQENAPISLTLTHYTELIESKGMVLMHGEVNTGDLLSFKNSMEAQNLTNQMQLYYAGDPELYAIVRQFNHDPQNFDYKILLNRLNELL